MKSSGQLLSLAGIILAVYSLFFMDVSVEVGDTGITSSRLAPMGKVKVNGHIVEAKTNDDFIDEGVEVKVLEVMNTNILVERKVKE